MADLTIQVSSNAPTGQHNEYLLILEFPISVAPDGQAYSILDPAYAERFKQRPNSLHGSVTMQNLLEELLPPADSGKTRRFSGLLQVGVYGKQVQLVFGRRITEVHENTAVRLSLKHYVPITATPRPERVTLEYKPSQRHRTIEVGNL